MLNRIPHKLDPLANCISQHSRNLLTATAATATAMTLPIQALAQQSPVLEEVIVTSQKRESNLQDTAISVQVLGGDKIDELGIAGFDDYVKFLPTVSYTSDRPGVSQVYMRGIVSGSNGNHSASQPSVAVYLDEQPITTINEILDLHAYDFARIETLAGPQGTLFGSSAQAGVLRIITNKPALGETEWGYDLNYNNIDEGDDGYTIEGFGNFPIGDNAAIRLVGWYDDQGGYVDNVADSVTYAASGIQRDNFDLVEDDFNEAKTTGARASLRVDLNENWTLTPSLIYQETDTTGVFFHDPDDLDDLEARQYFDTWYDDSWYQAALTVEGTVGNLDIVYAGAYLDRERDSQYDYTGYAIYLEELYADLGYACYLYTAEGDCADPTQYVDGDETWTRQSHELRIQSSQDQRFRYIAGLFYQDAEHDFDLQWIPPDMNPADSIIEGGRTVWQTKQVREDSEFAAFGELSFDFTDKFTGMFGARYYDYENKLYGFNGFIGHCTGLYIDGEFVEDRVNGVPQRPCFDTRILDDVQENDDVIYKVNLTYEFSDDLLTYFTWSEGYRPGGVNRARVDGIPGYLEDFTTNWELGWKATLLDGRMRFNGAVYYVEWEDFQYSILDFEVSNLTIIRNAGEATIPGLEFDMDFAATENLTLSISGSYTKAELEEDLVSDGDVLAPEGTELPFTPELQTSVIARYDTTFNGYDTYFQGAWNYTDDSYSDLRVDVRSEQESYNLLNLSAGVAKDSWSATIYMDNVTNELAEVNRVDPGYPSLKDTTIRTIRPRTVGIRFGQRF